MHKLSLLSRFAVYESVGHMCLDYIYIYCSLFLICRRHCAMRQQRRKRRKMKSRPGRHKATPPFRLLSLPALLEARSDHRRVMQLSTRRIPMQLYRTADTVDDGSGSEKDGRVVYKASRSRRTPVTLLFSKLSQAQLS